MPTQRDVRRIALSLPGASENPERFAFSVGKKGFAWVWNERVGPKKPRVPNPAVLAVRVESLAVKEALLASNTKKFFTEPHYNGFPAVLVRLSLVGKGELEALLMKAWECQVPRSFLKKLRH